MTDPVPSKDLVSQLRALPAGARLLGYTAAEHIERLETALRGIQSCSTCEACRGAATIALGGDQHNPSPSIRALAESAYKDGYGADLTDDRDLSDRTHELIRSLSRPAHEREGPHCSSCSCGMTPEPPEPDAYIVRVIEEGKGRGHEYATLPGYTLEPGMRLICRTPLYRRRAAQPPGAGQ